jgi:pyroglutamyl-peptidase
MSARRSAPADRSPLVLLTGFEPFDGADLNPSWEVARALDGELVAGARVVARQLPTTFAGAPAALTSALRALRPVAVLALGLAGSRGVVSVERISVNVIDARIPDNAGDQPIDQPALPGAPLAYRSTLPIKAIVARLREQGIAAEVSQTAGTFVCNQVFHVLMHALRRRPGVRAGFIHLPLLAGSPGAAPGMPLAQQVLAVRLAIETSLRQACDLVAAEGAVS